MGRMFIRDIKVSDSRRAISEKSVLGLKESIRAVGEGVVGTGLLHPIVVTENGTLVAGLHRMTACASLGWEDIPVTVLRGSDAILKLAEFDENLTADRGTRKERAVWQAKRKECYLVLYPETARGVAGGKGKAAKPGNKADANEISSLAKPTPSFAEDAAAKTGMNRRTVEYYTQVGEMPAETLEALEGSSIENSMNALLALARMPADDLAELTKQGTEALVKAANERKRKWASDSPKPKNEEPAVSETEKPESAKASKTAELDARVAELCNLGKGTGDIAKALGIEGSRVSEAKRRLGLTRVRCHLLPVIETVDVAAGVLSSYCTTVPQIWNRADGDSRDRLIGGLRALRAAAKRLQETLQLEV